MPGSKVGGAKARDTNIRLYGEDFYRNLSRAGGSVVGVHKGWYGDKERAKQAGSQGGSKRWEGRLGINQAKYLSYVALTPVKFGDGPLLPNRNKALAKGLLGRNLIKEIDHVLHLTPKGEEYLISNELIENLIEAPSKSLKVVSDERSIFRFAVWFPFSLTMSLVNALYVVIHYYLILGTLWAR